jgi:hypothetical protein
MIEMKDSGVDWIGEIPHDWEIVQTKRVFRSIKRVVGNQVGEYERLALTLNGIIKRSKEDNEGLQPEKFEGYQILKENELVFKLIDLENVKTSRVGLSSYTGLVSPAYIVLTNESKDNRFYYYWFMFMYYNEVFNHLGGDGVRSALNAKDLITIPVPFINECKQHRIADYLDEKCSKIDAIIKKQQTVIEKLKAYKLSIITEAVTNGLNPDVEMKGSGVEWIGEIPSNWKITSISRLATVVRGASPRPAGDPLYFNGSDVPWITVAEVTKDDGKYITSTSEYLTSAGAEKSRMVESGTLLLSNSGATLGVPKVTLIDGCINDGSLAFYNLKIDQIFLLYVLKSRTYELRKEMSGYGQPNLNTDIVKAIKIPLPPQEKQEDIVKYLDQKCPAIDKVIADRQVIIEKLGQYKKSLIYEVVTGKKEI